jgi:cyclophilin family peptidyl-prolyl cis-trans isomerase
MIRRVLISIFSGLALAAAAKAADQPAAPILSVVAPAEVVADPSNRLTLDLSTGGTVVIMLRPDAAPAHVERMKTLVRNGFYDGLIFHRVVPGFMAQGGDPTGTGEGGSALPDLKAEFNALPFLRGTLGAARAAAEDSANSQFFIMLAPNATLNNKYTAFGRVIDGMTAVDGIAPGEPPEQPTKIVRARLGG